MVREPLSPELVLVDPELGARARAALPERVHSPTPLPPAPQVAAPAEAPEPRHPPARPYPFWARVTAALWLLVLGILIGGAAIPHAQDRPRVLPPAEDAPATICERPGTPPTTPTNPINPPGQP